MRGQVDRKYCELCSNICERHHNIQHHVHNCTGFQRDQTLKKQHAWLALNFDSVHSVSLQYNIVQACDKFLFLHSSLHCTVNAREIVRLVYETHYQAATSNSNHRVSFSRPKQDSSISLVVRLARAAIGYT